MVKRLTLYRRSFKAFAMELLIPLLLIVAGFQLSRISFFFNSPSKQLVPSNYAGPQRVVMLKDTLLNKAADRNGNAQQVLTPQQFAAHLPGNNTFHPIYIDMQSAFPPDEYTALLMEQGLQVNDMRYGFQGRDAFKEFKHDVFDAQGFIPPDGSANASMAYGAYFLYEMNNSTKQFKVATFINTTSQDAAADYPQFMYESILRLATGNDNLHFNVHSSPWPVTFKLRRQQQTASSSFAVFVLAIAFSLLPSSIIAFICAEKERNLKH